MTTYRIGNHVPGILLGMVEARSVNVKTTTTTVVLKLDSTLFFFSVLCGREQLLFKEKSELVV